MSERNKGFMQTTCPVSCRFCTLDQLVCVWGGGGRGAGGGRACVKCCGVPSLQLRSPKLINRFNTCARNLSIVLPFFI